MLDKHNPYYREIKARITVTQAEATIAWFYSGKRQSLITNEIRFPVYADGFYDCTEKLQFLRIDRGTNAVFYVGSED